MLIDSLALPGAGRHLMTVDVVQVKPQSPDFESVYYNIKQKIVVR